RLPSDAAAMFDLAAEIGRDRDEAEAVLRALWVELHHVLVRHQAAIADTNIAAHRLLEDRPTSSLLRALEATEEARRAISSYVAPALAIERLIVRLAEDAPPTRAREAR